MAEHWNGGTGGKGSKPRPFAVPLEDFGNSHDRIFPEKKKFCDTCGKRFSWCLCTPVEDNTGTSKNEYQDILSTEDCLIEPDDKITRYNEETQQVLRINTREM